MNRIHFGVIAGLAALCGAILPNTTYAQAYTEARDTLRGATYFSVQVSTDALVDIQLQGGKFSESDEMTLGLSALFFDELASVTEYVMWLRHDGPRRWLTGNEPEAVNITIDGQDIELMPLHVTRPDHPSHDGFFIETLEYTLSPELFQEMMAAGVIKISLRTFQGLIAKQLSDAEKQTLIEFNEKVRQRHEDLRAEALAAELLAVGAELPL